MSEVGVMKGNVPHPRLVIIRGGFGGMNAALEAGTLPVDVILVGRSNHHTFQPWLYQLALADRKEYGHATLAAMCHDRGRGCQPSRRCPPSRRIGEQAFASTSRISTPISLPSQEPRWGRPECQCR